ncbi:hypothetical protein PEX1_048790 [Penicillium expansum]|uniref:Uncharacterized protein n=1 Tax=Penicillium expansum TaxID=27334 RepID=A0A0A2J7Y7_PENEN|nr:hypothetical protein PEX2_097980 [Penicillium expansum]KGO50881.1 hypothetical protein PEX1_048790 [Penicillium expansum]KGO56719.1 hypothetical protein PEX2_097980 [Penicillium expansum]
MSLSSPSRPAVFPTGFPAGWPFNYVEPFLVNTSFSTESLSHVVFSRLDIHHGVIDTNMVQNITTRGTLSGWVAFPTWVFLLAGFDEASITRQLKTISWKHERLDTAAWKWKEYGGGNQIGRT